jgi:hypothetical protein
MPHSSSTCHAFLAQHANLRIRSKCQRDNRHGRISIDYFLALILASSIVGAEVRPMHFKRGDRVLVRTADGSEHPRRALGDVTEGKDFAIVEVCREEEWEAAQVEGREPQGVPWPAEHVRLADEVPA